MTNDIFECCHLLVKDLEKDFPDLEIRYSCTLERIDLMLELSEETTITRFISIKHFETVEARDKMYKELVESIRFRIKLEQEYIDDLERAGIKKC